MKILLVTPYFVPAWSFGGPVKLVYELAQQYAKAGHDVTVATTDVLDKQHRHHESSAMLDGIHVLYFKNLSNWLAYHLNAYIPLGFAGWARRHLHEFDVIHCHDAFTWLNVVISRQAPRLKRPYFVQPHGAFNEDRVSARMTWFKWLFIKLFPGVLRNAHRIITSTEKEKNLEITRIDHSYIKKTIVVTNGIDAGQIRAPATDDRIRKELGVGAKELFILYFGRLQFIKGLDISVEALTQIKDLQWKYVVIGRDEGVLETLQRRITEAELQHHVVFHKPIFGPKVKEILAVADVFLFNSRSEGLPMAVLDACAAGLPSIISAECNVPEVGEYGAGVVLPENTPTATATALRQFATLGEEKRKIMQQRCHQVIREKFNLDDVVQTYLQLYQSAIIAPK